MAERKRPPLELHHNSDGGFSAGVGPGVGLTFVRSLFPTAERVIRIASAYFSLPGYRMARCHIRKDVQIHVLVGREDGVDLRKAVLAEITDDLAKSEVDLWESVRELVDRMKAGRFFIRDARQIETRFHCKFYICDDRALWHGSANYTQSGLSERGNAEQASVSRDPLEVVRFKKWYDDVAADATDLLAPLLARLEQWLLLAKPFDVYLAALFHLYDLAILDLGKYGHSPLYYQKAIVVRALRQMQLHRGAFAIVATGLGKTVIGADIAQRMKESGEIRRVILIAPRAVHPDWKRQLDARHLTWDVFTPETLFRTSLGARHHQATTLEENLRLADAQTLLIIDEAHFARNQLLTEAATRRPSLVLRRLAAPKQAGARVLLLTATPYSTSPQNLASVLALLPETQPGGLGVDLTWAAENVKSLIGLPVVNILGFPHLLDIAKRRNDIDANGRPFVRFGRQTRYLPRMLRLRRVSFRPVLEEEMQRAFDERCFTQAKRLRHAFVDDDGEVKRGFTDPVFTSTMTAWLSSPAALLEALERNVLTQGGPQVEVEASPPAVTDSGGQLMLALNMATLVPRPSDAPDANDSRFNPYRLPMAVPRSRRRQLLSQLIKHLSDESLRDEKLERLSTIIMNHCASERAKAIVFVRKRATAVYLHRQLRRTFATIGVECTVCERRGRARLRPLHERASLRRQFSPLSHDEPPPARPLSVLISTDADSIGVNLQDADVVINYDLPEAGDVLFQRAGRVLRMTTNPVRDIWFYTFVPEWTIKSLVTSDARRRAEMIVSRIMRRHRTASDILRASVLPDEEELDTSLERDIDAEQFLRDEQTYEGWNESPAAAAADRIALLEKYAERARGLPLSIHSARYYSGNARRVFVLAQRRTQVISIVHNTEADLIEDGSESAALDLVACEADESPAAVFPAEVERHANTAVRRWCEARSVNVAEVQKICAMLLIPQSAKASMADIVG